TRPAASRELVCSFFALLYLCSAFQEHNLFATGRAGDSYLVETRTNPPGGFSPVASLFPHRSADGPADRLARSPSRRSKRVLFQPGGLPTLHRCGPGHPFLLLQADLA